MQFFGGPFLAGFSDRTGRRPVLITCLLGASLAYALLGITGAAFGLGLMTGPLLGGLLSLYSLQAPALAASDLALLSAAFGLFVLPESLPKERRSRTPLLRPDPVSGIVRLIQTGATPPCSSPSRFSTWLSRGFAFTNPRSRPSAPDSSATSPRVELTLG